MTWVVLELESKCEQEDPDTVSKGIARLLRDPRADVFVPAIATQVDKDRVYHYLLEGYAFVREDSVPVQAFRRLENSKYVTRALTRGSSLATVSDAEIQKLRNQVVQLGHQGIGFGDRVKIVTGKYSQIEAMVVEVLPEEDSVQVYIGFRSKQIVTTLPRSFLQLQEKSPLAPLYEKYLVLKEWCDRNESLLKWETERPKLEASYWNYMNLHDVVVLSQDYATLEKLLNGDLRRDAESLGKGLSRLERLEGFLSKLWELGSILFPPPAMRRLTDTLDKVVRLEGYLEQMESLQEEMATLSRVEDEGKLVHLVIDGMNLACRVLYAPGTSRLSHEGVPTGVVYGFIRSLATLKSRFRDAKVYVTWDDSSQRRKALYNGYKANRPTGPSPFGNQLVELKEILTLLGVEQVVSPGEEADDVIGTLVQGPLKDSISVIYTTDRDMLQLVTESTFVLVPKLSTRREALYNSSEKVVEEYGVPPGQLVQVRAFCGDDSDNIPGVPRVAKKILKDLVKTYGTVQGVYGSGLAGLSKSQYEKLRTFEEQAKINLTLLRLYTVPLHYISPLRDLEEASARLLSLGIQSEGLLGSF